MAGKFALIIGNSEYQDSNLTRLKAPEADVNALSALLRNSEIGAFDEVITLANELSATIRRTIARFFAQKTADDLLLLYFSGHGVLDDRGELFLATKDTERDLIRGTAIPAAFVTSEMDSSRSKRQVLILDCCHSGAFARGSKGVVGASVGTASAFEGTGYGRAVLTATDATQFAWEGDQVIGNAENSLFTHYLIEGLQSGEADTDADGRITLDNLYDYVYGQVVKTTPKQTPGKWSYKQQGEIVIARNPKPVIKPAELPRQIGDAIESPLAGVREGAIRELERLLNGSHPGLALAAFDALKQLTEDDSRRVANAALGIVNAYEEAKHVKEQAREQFESERVAREKAEAERVEREKVAQERIVREKAEQEQLAKKKAEAERLAREKAEQERIAKEKAEAERTAREKAERERLAQQGIEIDRAARRQVQPPPAHEKAEREKLAPQKAEVEKRVARVASESKRPNRAIIVVLTLVVASIIFVSIAGGVIVVGRAFLTSPPAPALVPPPPTAAPALAPTAAPSPTLVPRSPTPAPALAPTAAPSPTLVPRSPTPAPALAPTAAPSPTLVR